jgi:hypothetical protein
MKGLWPIRISIRSPLLDRLGSGSRVDASLCPFQMRPSSVARTCVVQVRGSPAVRCRSSSVRILAGDGEAIERSEVSRPPPSFHISTAPTRPVNFALRPSVGSIPVSPSAPRPHRCRTAQGCRSLMPGSLSRRSALSGREPSRLALCACEPAFIGLSPIGSKRGCHARNRKTVSTLSAPPTSLQSS